MKSTLKTWALRTITAAACFSALLTTGCDEPALDALLARLSSSLDTVVAPESTAAAEKPDARAIKVIIPKRP